MIQLHEKQCPECGTMIEFSYERGVYENHIHCNTCDTYILVDEEHELKEK